MPVTWEGLLRIFAIMAVSLVGSSFPSGPLMSIPIRSSSLCSRSMAPSPGFCMFKNGTDTASKRLEAGLYGTNVQKLVDVYHLGKGLVTDTDNTLDKITNTIQSDDTWKTLHEDVHWVFSFKDAKDAKDANILKQAAVYVGDKTLDTVVSSFEAVKDAGLYLKGHSMTEMANDGLDLASKSFEQTKEMGSAVLDAAAHPIDTAGKALDAAADATQSAIDAGTYVVKGVADLGVNTVKGAADLTTSVAKGAYGLAGDAASYVKGWFS